MSINRINRYLKSISSRYKESTSTCSCYYWVQVKNTEYRIRCSDHFSYNKVNIVDIVRCNDNTYVINLHNGFFITCDNNHVMSELKAMLLLLPNIVLFTNNVLKGRSDLSTKYNKLAEDKNILESKFTKINEAYTKAIINKNQILEKVKETTKELNEIS